MAQSKYLKQSGELIYPYTIMDNILDSQTGNPYSSILENKFDAILEHNGQKNLATATGVVRTNAGITFTPQSDGSVSVSGTATAESWSEWTTVLLNSGTYIISGSTNNTAIELYSSDGNTLIASSMDGEETIFTIASTASYRLYVEVPNGKTVNTTVYPMIRDARIESNEYIPYLPQVKWNYMTFSNSSAGVTSGSVRWIIIGKICFANFYDVQLTNVSHANGARMCSGLPPAENAMLFLISAWGTSYSAMRMRIDTDGGVYFHYAGTSLAQQHYGQVFYIIK